MCSDRSSPTPFPLNALLSPLLTVPPLLPPPSLAGVYRQILVDGVNFLSAVEAVQHRAARNGCGNKGQAAGPVAADGQMQCTDFCGNKPGAKPAKLCGMTEVLHDTGELGLGLGGFRD